MRASIWQLALILVLSSIFIFCSHSTNTGDVTSPGSGNNNPGGNNNGGGANPAPPAGQNKILMFVAYQDTYYSEYKVMLEALRAAGYTVEVRSAGTGFATAYSSDGDIVASANSLPNSDYNDFTTSFQQDFGTSWNPTHNAVNNQIPLDGRIQDVINMNDYVALVMPGGNGSVAYRYDGTYGGQTNGSTAISAAEVQAAAEKLNQLAADALSQEKPVLAQCHGASLPVFFRIPGTVGQGDGGLGLSILNGQNAAGYPTYPATTNLYNNLGVTLQPEARVTISRAASTYTAAANASHRIITSRDWYPQTVAHATRSLLNILQTYPNATARAANKSILILHGGALDSGNGGNNCLPGNRSNDVPCNYFNSHGLLPADYTNLTNLLIANSSNDNYNFLVSSINLTETIPFNINDVNSILLILNAYDTVIFYKHWVTGMSDALQNALISYADQGGGVVALHHALYNDVAGANNKNILTQQLFGATSEANTWSANLVSFRAYATNYGHFVSTFGTPMSGVENNPAAFTGNAPRQGSNQSKSSYHYLDIDDEIYWNMSFTAGQTFGRAVGDITPLFSNNANNASESSDQKHTTGFVKHFNPTGDASVGRLVFFTVGERTENYNLANSFAQVIRNAVLYTSLAQ